MTLPFSVTNRFFSRFQGRGLHDCATWNRTTTPTIEHYPCAARLQRTELCKFAYAQLCIRSHWPGRMRRWYCSQITRRADARREDECTVVADDDTPDSIRLCSKWYGPIGEYIDLLRIQQYVCITRVISYGQSMAERHSSLYVWPFDLEWLCSQIVKVSSSHCLEEQDYGFLLSNFRASKFSRKDTEMSLAIFVSRAYTRTACTNCRTLLYHLNVYT